MNGLATIAALNKKEVASYYKRKPLKALSISDDVRSSPDYSGGDIDEIARHFRVKLHKTYFVDSSGFGSSGEPAMTFSAFDSEVEKLIRENPDKQYYSALNGVGQFQVYVSIFYKARR